MHMKNEPERVTRRYRRLEIGDSVWVSRSAEGVRWGRENGHRIGSRKTHGQHGEVVNVLRVNGVAQAIVRFDGAPEDPVAVPLAALKDLVDERNLRGVVA